MARYNIFLLLIITFLFSACREKPAPVVIVKRDTTITAENAFSAISLDSLQLEHFINEVGINDSSAHFMRNFYNSRNYHFAWFTEDGLAEQARAFWNLHNNFLNYSRDSSMENKELNRHMQLFINGDTIFYPGSEQIRRIELQLTEHFFKYANHAYGGRVDPEELQWYIPRKKVDAMALLDTLLAANGKNLEALEPLNMAYKLLKKELLRYYEIEKKGSWQQISMQKKKYKLGDAGTFIPLIRQRLAVLGDYSGTDTSDRFDPALSVSVKQVQKRFGLKQDGVITAALVNELNIPVKDRVEQLLINLERMRWLPKDQPSDRIVVNIPAFKLHVYEQDQHVFDMDIVVGKEGSRTVIFNDELKYIVFSPYWNIPRSIVRNEILPGLSRNPNYLAGNNMELTGYSNGLPVIRQKPGTANALGRVKFIFPNSYSIYFHDTPAKSLFKKEKRAFSHGCIRLAEPKKMAQYLLRNKPEWTSEKIREAMYSGKEKWVTLDKQVPVSISYFTAWVDNEGLLNFRKDIYGRDQKMVERLFEQQHETSDLNEFPQ